MLAVPASRVAPVRIVVGVTSLVIAGVMPTALLAAFSVRIEESFSISDPQIGFVLSCYYMVSVGLAVVAGRLADRIGPGRSAIWGSCLTMSALLGTSMVAGHYPALLGCYVVGGAGLALTSPTTNVILANSIPVKRLGVAIGIKQSAAPLGAMIAGFAVATPLAADNWRLVFVLAIAIPSIGLFTMGGLHLRRVLDVTTGLVVAQQVPRQSEVSVWKMRWLILGAASGTFSSAGVTGFLVLGLVDRGFTESTAGLVLGIASIATVCVRIGSGALLDRRAFRSGRGMVALLLVGSLGYVFLSTGWAIGLIAGALIAYAAGWGWQAIYHYSFVEFFPRDVGAATGAGRLGVATGAAVGPSVFGYLAHTVGFRLAWLTSAGLMAMAAWLLGRGYRHLYRAKGES